MRSRVAAQMLAGEGFEKVYNLSGGIKAWGKELAIGSPDTGMHLFEDNMSVEQTIAVGFGLEEGLRDFYLSLHNKVKNSGTRELFLRLADIEIVHQEQLVKLYNHLTGKSVSCEEFRSQIVEPVMEGGLSTSEYLKRYNIDYNSEVEVLSMALAIEAQALDLYLRAADDCSDELTKKALYRVAEEERGHITLLTGYLDSDAEVA